MFGLFQKRTDEGGEDWQKLGKAVPPELRPRRAGPFGIFRKKLVLDDDYYADVRKLGPPPVERVKQGLLGLLPKMRIPHAGDESGAGDASGVPPLHRRLPEWAADQVGRLKGGLIEAPAAFGALVRTRQAFWLLCLAGLAGGAAAGAIAVHARANAPVTVAMVKGSGISEREFHHRMVTIAGPQVMGSLVNERLLMQFARSRHALPSETEIRARVRQTASRPAATLGFDLSAASQDDLRAMARVALAQEHLFGSAADVTDAEIRAYYAEQTSPANRGAKFYTPESVSLSIILCPSEMDIMSAMQALRQGQPFEQVARTYSRDKSAASGGEIPPVFRGRARAVAVPGFEAAAFALQPGETARPTKFLDAWFILRCRERTGASTRPLEAVRDECRRDVAVIKSAAAHGQQISREYQAFRDRAYVQVFWTSYLANLAGSPNQ